MDRPIMNMVDELAGMLGDDWREELEAMVADMRTARRLIIAGKNGDRDALDRAEVAISNALGIEEPTCEECYVILRADGSCPCPQCSQYTANRN